MSAASEGVAAAYYRFCEGRWRTPVELGLRAWPLLALPRWSGIRMHTEVVCHSDRDEVVHTTWVGWLGIPLYSSVEIFAIARDGAAFTVRGRITWPTFWGPEWMSGSGRVHEDARSAEYDFRFGARGVGMDLRQTTAWKGDHLEIAQSTRWFRGVQRLRREAG